MLKLRSFSLIELLVVVAIIAVLAAVAIPAYTQYKGRQAIGVALATLQQAAQRAMLVYDQTGSWPSSITFGSLNMVSGNGLNTGWYLLNQNNIASIGYFQGSDGLGIAVGATVLNLTGAPNYIAPSTTVASGGAPSDGYIGANELWLGVRYVNGTMKVLCGGRDHVGSPNLSIASGYLPGNCTCDYILTWANTGVYC